MNGNKGLAFARLVSSAVMSQAVLSAGSFAIGLILIRGTSDNQYALFIMASNAILLLTSLQNAFFNPPLAIRMHRLDLAGRGALVGGLYRAQRRIVVCLAAAAAIVTIALYGVHVLNATTGALVLAAIGATIAVLYREYFRLVLFAHRRPQDVLRADVFYVVLMVVGVALATLTATPAIAALVMLSFAAIAAGFLVAQTLRRREAWNIRGGQGILREIVPLGMWSVAGAAIHWTFSQGYIYLVAGTLDVRAVAAVAATRLLVMPINLLSTGIGPLMLPFASGWLHRHGAALLLRRLVILGSAVAMATLVYFAVLWFSREWIFSTVLAKQFAQRDGLLILWGLTFLVTAVRGQLAHLLAAEGRFRFLGLLTLVSAIVALAASYWGMLRFGVTGAVAGILVGETINAIGIVGASLHKATRPVSAAVPT